MDDIYKDESEFGQNSERSLNDELSDLPISLDLNLSNHPCPACGAPCLDIGLESGDRFCRWICFQGRVLCLRHIERGGTGSDNDINRLNR